MSYPPYTRAYEYWAPFIARLIFGFQFLLAAVFKVTWHAQEVAATAGAGVPFPEYAVWAAFAVEVVLGIAVVIGYKTRIAALLLALYTLLLAVIFYRDIADPNIMGAFVSHLSFVAGFLYVSVYGAQHVAVKKDLPPTA